MKIGISPVQAAVLSCLAVSAASSFAQSVPTLQETVVTATRMEQPITDVVADVSIIDRAEIERSGATSVLGVLSRQPGLQAIQNPGLGQVFIRGTDSHMTAVYIDGVRVNSQDGARLLSGGAPWDQIPLSQIDRIEILRGPASAVYGSDAMGGVIQLFTRQGEEGVHPYMNVGMGSYNLRKSSFGVSGASEGWRYALGMSSDISDGYDNQPTFVHTSPRIPVAQRSSNFRLGRKLTVGQDVEITALTTQADSQYVPWNGGANYVTTGKTTTTAVRWDAQWTDAWQSNVTVSRGILAQKDTYPFDYFTVTQGLLWENRLRLGAGTLSAVLEQKKDGFESQMDGNGSVAFQGDRTQDAAALGWGVASGRNFWQINARRDRDSIFGSRDSGAAAYAFALTPQWRVGAGAGTAFKAPTLSQLYVGSTKNSDLQAETSRSSEMSVAYAQDASALKLVVYRNEISNLITSASPTFVYYNVDKASILGATLSGHARVQQLETRFSLDVLDPRNEATGKLLSKRARKTAMAGLDWSVGRWRLGVESQFVDERFDNAANTDYLPSYTLWNLSATTKVSKDAQLVMRVDNAADKVYAPMKDFEAPRATYFVGIQWQPRN